MHAGSRGGFERGSHLLELAFGAVDDWESEFDDTCAHLTKNSQPLVAFFGCDLYGCVPGFPLNSSEFITLIILTFFSSLNIPCLAHCGEVPSARSMEISR